MADDRQVELDLDTTEATEVEVETVEVEGSGDQFERADSATQKRIDRLTKKMREAERRESEAVNYAKQVQTESVTLKNRMANLDNSYVHEYTNRVTSQLDQAEKELGRAMELGDTQAAVEANRKITSLSIENDRASQAKMQHSSSSSNSSNSHNNSRKFVVRTARRKSGRNRTIGLVKTRP